MHFSSKGMRLTKAMSFLIIGIGLCVSTILAIQPSTAQGEASLSGSAKSVSASTAEQGDTLSYTLVISNSGDSTASNILVTDTLPSALSYVSGTLSTPSSIGVASTGSGVSSNVITWTGSIQPDSAATISYDAIISGSAAIDSFITNTVLIAVDSTVLTRTASTQVVSDTTFSTVMPIISMPYNEPTLTNSESVSFSNNNYTWGLSWSFENTPSDVKYLLEESTSSDFSTISNSYVVTDTSQSFNRSSSDVANIYYYRVRIFSQIGSSFSSPQTVVIVPDPPTVDSTRVTAVGTLYQWDVSWATQPTLSGVDYVVQESTDPTFATGVTSLTTSDLSMTFNHAASTTPVYYYRVRLAEPSTAPWSEVHQVISAYFDDFSTETGWEIRRQDFDDTENVMSYENGTLKMHVRGRWDYFIASPLVPAPEPPYRIQTYVKFDGPGNLNTYGLIFGGDSNGGECPTVFPPTNNLKTDSVQAPNDELEISPASDELDVDDTRAISDNVYDNCLNHYYRNILLWYGSGNNMRAQVKAIHFHDDNNSGRGDGLLDWRKIEVSSDSSNNWNLWSWEVYPDGTMKLYAGDSLEFETSDPDRRYINDPYWGFWASTDEYPGSDPLWDWVLVEPIN